MCVNYHDDKVLVKALYECIISVLFQHYTPNYCAQQQLLQIEQITK